MCCYLVNLTPKTINTDGYFKIGTNRPIWFLVHKSVLIHTVLHTTVSNV